MAANMEETVKPVIFIYINICIEIEYIYFDVHQKVI